MHFVFMLFGVTKSNLNLFGHFEKRRSDLEKGERREVKIVFGLIWM